MRTRCSVAAVLFILVAATVAQGQTPLAQDAALEILAKLASQKRITWIPAGTIEAGHQRYRAARTMDQAEIDGAIERKLQDDQSPVGTSLRALEMQEMRLEAIPFNVRYDLANEYTMNSHVVLKYDGDRFYWSIDVASRSDSVKLPSELQGNFMVDQFKLEWNERRAYAWNGQEYTVFSRSANHATVDAAGKLPRAVNGPLTAGVIPWGYGALTYENLSAGRITATEVVFDQAPQIHMAIEQTDGTLMDFVLDPTKDYAAASWTVVGLGDKVTSLFYSDYQKIAGNWVPGTVLIEHRDALTDRLLRSDKWDFTKIDASIPGPEQFEMQYQADTLIEYYSPLSERPAVYRYSDTADMKQLLAERLAYAASKRRQPQNCATATVQRAATQLGKSVSPDKLAQLVDVNGQTTMGDLKQFVQKLGLYCRAVEGNISALAKLPACQTILHLPAKNHFVVLDHLDERDAWIVDLTKPTFYYRQDASSLPIDPSKTVALLVSDRPISGPLNDVSNARLTTLVGGDSYTCTYLYQKGTYDTCDGNEFDCWGVFTVYYHRYLCEAAPSGTCFHEWLPRIARTDCITEPSTGNCISAGGWDVYYMDACD